MKRKSNNYNNIQRKKLKNNKFKEYINYINSISYNFNGLNWDILYLIFYFCDFNSLFTGREICKLWKEIIDYHLIWRKISFKNNILNYSAYKYNSYFSLVLKNIHNICVLCRKNYRIRICYHELSNSLLLSEKIFCRYWSQDIFLFSINHDLICNECCVLLYNYFVKKYYNYFITYYFNDPYFSPYQKSYYKHVIKNGRTDLVHYTDVDNLSNDIEICL